MSQYRERLGRSGIFACLRKDATMFVKWSFHFVFILFIATTFVGFAQVDTDTLANLTPEQLQTLVNGLSQEELQQFQPLCQQLFPDPTTAADTAAKMDNGQIVLVLCQSVEAKLGATPSGQSENPLAAGQNEQAQTPRAAGSGGLSGLYKYYSSLGMVYPDGTVVPDPPVYWYFFPDGYVYKGNLGHEAVNCAANFTNGCDTYTLSGGTLTLGDGQPLSFSQSGETLFINGEEWTYVRPESFTLEGSFESTFGASAGSGADASASLSITTITFNDNGTFSLEGATSVVTGVAVASGGSKSSSSSGTYLIRDNNLILSYGDGRVETLVFDYSESAEEGVYGVYVGGTLYY